MSRAELFQLSSFGESVTHFYEESVIVCSESCKHSRTPLIRKLVIRIVMFHFCGLKFSPHFSITYK